MSEEMHLSDKAIKDIEMAVTDAIGMAQISRRERIATACLAGLGVWEPMQMYFGDRRETAAEAKARVAIENADALIKALDAKEAKS